MRFSGGLPAAVLAALIAALPSPADAADACTGKIGKLPTVITKSGVWCMKKNLATAANNITAIDIQASNVTIDCNGFTLDGLAAGPDTSSAAIQANGTPSNITVRNCTIRGFQTGIGISIFGPEGSGHLVEDNRLEQITANGIYVIGHGSVVRRNHVVDTRGKPGLVRATAILVFGDAIDNLVDGMSGAADVADFAPEGIYAGGVGNLSGVGFLAQGNRVRNLVPKGTSVARGIITAATNSSLRGNTVAQAVMTTGQGIFCSQGGIARDNDVLGYTQANTSCGNGGGNVGF